jgi:signal transduction histidine kinase/ketosteroid isomerase-like protein
VLVQVPGRSPALARQTQPDGLTVGFPTRDAASLKWPIVGALGRSLAIGSWVFVTGVRSVVERYYDAFNARDWDAWAALLDQGVEITIEDDTLIGPAAAYAYTAETIRRYPGMRYVLERVVAESNDMIVMECRLVNPAGERSADAWKLDGPVCQIYQVSDERIVSIRGYYSPSAIDRTPIADVPSRADATRIAEERVALQRVTTLVADGAPPADLFAAVTEEVGRLLGGDLAGMIRFESDETIVAVATWAAAGEHKNVSGRWPLDGDRLATRIRNSGLPVREDAWADVGGPIADFIREELQARSSVGSPIIVERQVWGALFVHSTQSTPLPDDTELRLGHFTQLVATVMANVQAHADLRRLAEEQAALRRVAELVAHESPAERVFAAVAEEVGKLLGVSSSAVLRFDTEETLTVLAAWGEPDMARHIGRRLPISGDNTAALVLQTGRPARMDDQSTARGAIAAIVRDLGITSTISCPVIVNGRPWGAIAVNSLQPEPLPPGTEQRVGQFTELVATAIANVQARADLTASRARLVAASDEARRRIERNLHDGVQQRLISLSLAVRGAQAMLPGAPDSPDLRRQLARVAQGLIDVLDDLRELSRGLHPAILSEAGLDPALRAVARRSSVPIRLHLNIDGRLNEPIEVAAYYVVSEVLANVSKHARATSVDIRAQASDDRLDLTIQDDGIGGADPSRGSGLVGLSDRINALGGTIVITSPSGQGTRVCVALPISDEPTGDDSRKL